VEYFWAIKGGAKSSNGQNRTNVPMKVKKSDYVVAKTSSEEREANRNRREFEPEKAGRPNCLDDVKLHEMLKLYYTHPYSYRQLADMFGVSRMTVWRAVQGIQFQL